MVQVGIFPRAKLVGPHDNTHCACQWHCGCIMVVPSYSRLSPMNYGRCQTAWTRVKLFFISATFLLFQVVFDLPDLPWEGPCFTLILVLSSSIPSNSRILPLFPTLVKSGHGQHGPKGRQVRPWCGKTSCGNGRLPMYSGRNRNLYDPTYILIVQSTY